MRKFNYFLIAIIVLSISNVFSQKTTKPIKVGKIGPSIVKKALDFSVSIPARDMKPSDGPRTEEEQKAFKKIKREKEKLNGEMKYRDYPYASSSAPFGNDPVWQKIQGKRNKTQNRAANLNFAGQDSPYTVSDCNGAVGPNHYMQAVNTTYAIWDKSGNQVVAPTDFNTLFEGVTGATNNDGDPIVLYDEQADRWLVAEFSLPYSNNYMLIAVSTSNDPTGTWYRWSFDVADMPDYEKFGIWRDGYYMSTNNGGNDDTYVFERDIMLAGGSDPQMVGFTNNNRPDSQFHCLEPLDNDGQFAPTGTPGQFITINDDAWNNGTDELWIFELSVNWANTSASTFERTQQITVADFDSNFGSSWDNIAQKGTNQKVDAVPQVLMFRAQYRNFGTTQTIVCAHSVDVDDTDHAGIRWYELESTGGDWSIRQQGTYAPDSHSRWIPSIAMDANHNIALGYNISSSTMYPGIRYCGQSSVENALATGIMDIAEETVVTGTSSHTTDNRWADYAEMSLDPEDDATFWFTTEYADGTNTKATQITNFLFEPAVVYTTDAGASDMISPISGTNLTATNSVEIKVRNYGSTAISNIPVYYSLNGGTAVSETITSTINAGEIVNYTFSGNVDLSTLGSYEFKIYTGLSGDENHNNDTITKIIINSEPEYCSASCGGGFEYISKVEFGDILNPSDAQEYSDFTAYSTSISQGSAENLTVTLGNGYSSDQCLVWIDWNQDFIFDASEKVLDTPNGEGPYTATIDVPNDATVGNTRMRIRIHDTGYSISSDACSNSDYGEVEDYTVNISLLSNIKNIKDNSLIQITPNPASDFVNVNYKDIDFNEIKIVDITGKTIFIENRNTKNKTTFDFRNKAKGVYFLNLIKDKDIIETVKFIVQH